MATTPSFAGEIQFRRYSDSSTQGPGVYFGLADRDALEAFIGKEGRRFMAVLVEVGDDEQPVPPTPRKDTRGPLCREACDLCAMPEFRLWINKSDGSYIADEAEAKAWVCGECGIDSRKELDSSESAAATFVRLIRIPFMRWQRGQRQAT